MWQPLTKILNPISSLWLIWTVLKKKQICCRCYKEGSQVHMHPESRYWCPCHSLVVCSGPLFWYINACWNREQASSHQLKIHLRVIATGTGIGASRISCIQWVWPDWNVLRENKAVMLECISEGWRWSSTSTWKPWHCRTTSRKWLCSTGTVYVPNICSWHSANSNKRPPLVSVQQTTVHRRKAASNKNCSCTNDR